MAVSRNQSFRLPDKFISSYSKPLPHYSSHIPYTYYLEEPIMWNAPTKYKVTFAKRLRKLGNRLNWYYFYLSNYNKKIANEDKSEYFKLTLRMWYLKKVDKGVKNGTNN